LYILALCSIVSVLSCVTAVGSVVAFDCNYNKRRLLLLLLLLVLCEYSVISTGLFFISAGR